MVFIIHHLTHGFLRNENTIRYNANIRRHILRRLNETMGFPYTGFKNNKAAYILMKGDGTWMTCAFNELSMLLVLYASACMFTKKNK